MKIQKTPPYKPSMGWGIRTQTTRYGKCMSTMSEYTLDNGKRLVTIHNSINGEKVAITKNLYEGYKLIKEKIIQFVNGKKKVTRLWGADD